MKKCFWSLLILIPVISNAQDSYSDYKHELNFSLFSVVDIQNPNFTLGYYYRLTDRISVGADIGGAHKSFRGFSSVEDAVGSDYRFFAIRPEIQYYFDRKGRVEQFAAVQPFYLQHSDSFYDQDYIEQDDGEEYDFDTANYRRIKYGLNLNYGIVMHISKHFGLVQKAGIGFRLRDVTYSNIANLHPHEDEDGMFLESIQNYKRQEGVAAGFNFAVDLKLFYRF